MTTKPIAELLEAAKRGAELDEDSAEKLINDGWNKITLMRKQHAQDKARFDAMADLLGKALHALNRIEWMNDDTDEGIISRTALTEIESGLEKLAVRE